MDDQPKDSLLDKGFDEMVGNSNSSAVQNIESSESTSANGDLRAKQNREKAQLSSRRSSQPSVSKCEDHGVHRGSTELPIVAAPSGSLPENVKIQLKRGNVSLEKIHEGSPPKAHHERTPPKAHHERTPPKAYYQRTPPKAYQHQSPPKAYYQRSPTKAPKSYVRHHEVQARSPLLFEEERAVLGKHCETLFPKIDKPISIVIEPSATQSTASQGASPDGSSYQQTESRHLVAVTQDTDLYAEQNREPQVQSSISYKQLIEQVADDIAYRARLVSTRIPMVAAPFEQLESKITTPETPNADEQCLQGVDEPIPLVQSAPLNDPSNDLCPRGNDYPQQGRRVLDIILSISPNTFRDLPEDVKIQLKRGHDSFEKLYQLSPTKDPKSYVRLEEHDVLGKHCRTLFPEIDESSSTVTESSATQSLKSKITASETPNTDEQCLQDVVEPIPLVQSAPPNDPSNDLCPRCDDYPQQGREDPHPHYGHQDSSNTQQSSEGSESSVDPHLEQLNVEVYESSSEVNESTETHSVASQGSSQNPESSLVTTD